MKLLKHYLHNESLLDADFDISDDDLGFGKFLNTAPIKTKRHPWACEMIYKNAKPDFMVKLAKLIENELDPISKNEDPDEILVVAVIHKAEEPPRLVFNVAIGGRFKCIKWFYGIYSREVSLIYNALTFFTDDPDIKPSRINRNSKIKYYKLPNTWNEMIIDKLEKFFYEFRRDLN